MNIQKKTLSILFIVASLFFAISSFWIYSQKVNHFTVYVNGVEFETQYTFDDFDSETVYNDISFDYSQRYKNSNFIILGPYENEECTIPCSPLFEYDEYFYTVAFNNDPSEETPEETPSVLYNVMLELYVNGEYSNTVTETTTNIDNYHLELQDTYGETSLKYNPNSGYFETRSTIYGPFKKTINYTEYYVFIIDSKW